MKYLEEHQLIRDSQTEASGYARFVHMLTSHVTIISPTHWMRAGRVGSCPGDLYGWKLPIGHTTLALVMRLLAKFHLFVVVDLLGSDSQMCLPSSVYWYSGNCVRSNVSHISVSVVAQLSLGFFKEHNGPWTWNNTSCYLVATFVSTVMYIMQVLLHHEWD